MCIGALGGRLGLRRAAPRASATWPFGLVGLRATSHNRRTLWDIAQESSIIISPLALVPIHILFLVTFAPLLGFVVRRADTFLGFCTCWQIEASLSLLAHLSSTVIVTEILWGLLLQETLFFTTASIFQAFCNDALANSLDALPFIRIRASSDTFICNRYRVAFYPDVFSGVLNCGQRGLFYGFLLLPTAGHNCFRAFNPLCKKVSFVTEGSIAICSLHFLHGY
jgi:hypothetical protein